MTIHATAVVDPQAEVHETASVGAYSVIGANVSIGPNTVIDAHAVISGHTRIGADNHIGSFSSLGTPPQDIHYKDEPTELLRQALVEVQRLAEPIGVSDPRLPDGCRDCARFDQRHPDP